MGRLSTALALVALMAGSCRNQGLTEASGILSSQGHVVDFGQVIVGSVSTKGWALQNTGPNGLPVRWEVPGPPFESADLPSRLDTGTTSLRLLFRPGEERRFTGTLEAHAGEGFVTLELKGEGIPVPECPTSVVCHRFHFDLEAQACVDEPFVNGAACAPHSVCVDRATCQEGRCVGRALDCDDHDACTLDLCDAEQGCRHQPTAPCPGDGRCLVGLCDKVRGCTLVQAGEGSPCGPNRSCDVADVCISGECVERRPPDGFVCAVASPCQTEGRCQGSVCVQGAAIPIQPAWSLDTRPDSPDQLVLHDLVIEPEGQMTLMGFFSSPPVLRANSAGASRLPVSARRCILWNGRLLCADYPSNESGVITSIDLNSAQTQWSFDLASQRPDWARLVQPGRVFLARLASLGTDRLAALFEGYPKDLSSETQCRVYFLALLDNAGTMISGAPLTHPLLAECNHPHPFGVVADAAGSLYLAFSPTPTSGAPLPAEAPTLLMGFSRDGLPRWNRTEPFKGGELAVASGLLYAENSADAYRTADGLPVTAYPGVIPGRPVATTERLVLSPTEGATELVAYDVNRRERAWTHRLATGETFPSDQLRLAGWRTNPAEPPRNVVLVFVSRGQTQWLAALNVDHGGEEWSCPLAGESFEAAQMMEIANGSMAVMSGSTKCGLCDPPYANSRAAFYSFTLPGIELPRAPWTGTWGGPGHDHQEDAATLQGGPPQ